MNLISAESYNLVYLVIVLIFSLYEYLIYRKKVGVSRNKVNVGSFIFVIFIILFVGIRPLSAKYFTDTYNFYIYYQTFYENVDFSLDLGAQNFIFDNLLALWGSLDLGMPSFSLLVSAIYFGAAYLAIKKIFPYDAFATYLVFLGAFSTFSYATNGIKAGAAASLFLLALAYRNNLKICIPLVFISLGFHHSMQLPVIAFFITLFYKNTSVYICLWLLSLILSAAHISALQSVFAGLTDEHGAEYLLVDDNTNWGGKTGFRLDFVIYSAVPILVTYFSIIKNHLEMSKLHTCIFNVYLLTNAVWMLCMYASYTNRIAYLSWLLYPVVLVLPFINSEGNHNYAAFSKVMLAHLGFTLFMYFIYY